MKETSSWVAISWPNRVRSKENRIFPFVLASFFQSLTERLIMFGYKAHPGYPIEWSESIVRSVTWTHPLLLTFISYPITLEQHLCQLYRPFSPQVIILFLKNIYFTSNKLYFFSIERDHRTHAVNLKYMFEHVAT